MNGSTKTQTKNSNVMKKSTLLLIGILFLAVPLYGQDTTTVQASKYEYCQIWARSKLTNHKKLIIKVDYGTYKDADANLIIKDKNGNEFTSMIATLNYLVDKGWEFVQAVSYIDGTGSTNYQIVHYYILKRPKQPKP